MIANGLGQGENARRLDRIDTHSRLRFQDEFPRSREQKKRGGFFAFR
jgi:hypothetical protein